MDGPLRRIQVRIPDSPHLPVDELLLLLAPFGTVRDHVLTFTPSQPGYLPVIDLGVAEVAQTTFRTDATAITLPLVNTTGQVRVSPHVYTPISLAEARSRIGGFAVATLDHAGIDLPWFDGVHPELRRMRNQLSGACAYHRWFADEDWDFILPATEAEMADEQIDYEVPRRPKFELVSIATTTTPIIQLDFSVHADYEQIADRFPEGIPDPQRRNVWVYLQNDLGVDVCLVIGEHTPGDWSHLFRGHRL